MISQTNICLLLVFWLCADHLVLGNDFRSPDTTELKVNQTFANEDDVIIGIKPYFVKPDSLYAHIVKPTGNTALLVCKVKGSPEPTITWTKDDNVINREMVPVKYGKYKIILEDLIPNDTGNYTCEACNEHGCIKHSTEFIVVERISSLPLIKIGYPKNLTVFVNHTAEFECPTFSDLSLYIDWFKFPAQKGNNTNFKPQILKQNTGILRLDNVTFEDEGWYTCHATNSLGSSEAATNAYLTVVADLPADPMKLSMHRLPIWLLILIIILMTIFIIAIGVAFAIFKKFQTGKRNKQLTLERETMMTKNYYD